MPTLPPIAPLSRAGAPLGVPVIDVQPHAGLQDEDFADLFHLVNSGRDKWTPLIARALAVVLRQGG